MTASTLPKSRGYVWVGGVGLLLGAAYLGASVQMPFGRLDRPGAAVFPVIVGVMLVLVSLAAIWEGWQMDRAQRVGLPAGADRKRLLCLVGLLIAYFVALPWLGQIIATVLFCAVLMRLVSPIAWPRILAYSVVMSVVLYVTFVVVFKVPLPRGILAF